MVTRLAVIAALTALLVACSPAPAAELLAKASEERVDPSTLVELPGRWLGVRLAPRDIAVVSFTPDGEGGYDAAVPGRSDLAAPGQNTVHMSGGSGGALLFGTAAPDIAHVEIEWEDVQAYGGQVHNGVWLIWLPTDDSPMARPWQFVRGDGSIAMGGSGPVSPAVP